MPDAVRRRKRLCNADDPRGFAGSVFHHIRETVYAGRNRDKDAFDLIVPVYRDYCERYADGKIILMGDSAGGGLSLALAEYFRMEGIRLPDELVLISPWVDTVMENEEIKAYEPKDPFLCVSSLRVWRMVESSERIHPEGSFPQTGL